MIYTGDDPLYAVLLQAESLRRGIVPIPMGTSSDDMNRNMSGMSIEDQRTAKRKFRKAWRRAAKQSAAKVSKRCGSAKAGTDRYLRNELGLGAVEPTRRHKRGRKFAVMSMIREEVRRAREALEANLAP